MNILILYNATQTYTNTVFEHIACFGKYSKNKVFFSHQDQTTELNVDLSRFDVVAIHYSIRICFDQISPSTANALSEFKGLKLLFIQDEYNHTKRAWYWINTLGIQLVFTVVPETWVERIYPVREFPNTRFVSNLTGYVPDDLKLNLDVKPPSQRPLIVGYRGRPLPIYYGQLGMEKIAIGKLFKTYCDAHSVKNDIAWSEKARIYGPSWYEFMVSCRSMLGSESGSNVFDWDGTLVKRIAKFRNQNSKVGDAEIYEKFIRIEEIDGIMNQVSPRVFEAIAARTVLVLFEGNYSGVVKAGIHFISVKKDGSNLVETIRLLQDESYVDAMADRAYQDVITSGKYSYQSFVRLVDEEISISLGALVPQKSNVAACRADMEKPISITTSPIRSVIPPGLAMRISIYVWSWLPENVRRLLIPVLKRFLKKY
jgi:hypothetical protein